MWWASHHGAGMVQPGKAQPWSRAVMALRMWGGKILVVRPMSRIRPSLPSTTGMMSASQAIFRTVAALTGPVNVNEPVPGIPATLPGVLAGDPLAGAVAGSLARGVFEPVQEVAVVDGDHDLRAEPSRGRECIRGQGYLAGADEPVEEPLRPGPPVQIRVRVLILILILIRGTVSGGGRVTASIRGTVRSRAVAVAMLTGAVTHSSAGSGAGVGGGVHHGQQWFVLVRGGENFHVVQPAAGRAEEHPLPPGQFLLGRLGAVLIDSLNPPPCHPGQEIGVVLHRSMGQDVLHPDHGVLGGVVPDPVQRHRDDRRRPRRHQPARDRRTKLRPHGRFGAAGEPRPRQRSQPRGRSCAGPPGH